MDAFTYSVVFGGGTPISLAPNAVCADEPAVSAPDLRVESAPHPTDDVIRRPREAGTDTGNIMERDL